MQCKGYTWKGPTGNYISIEDLVQYLGVIVNENLEFGDNSDKIRASQVMSGVTVRTFLHKREKTDDEKVLCILKKQTWILLHCMFTIKTIWNQDIKKSETLHKQNQGNGAN